MDFCTEKRAIGLLAFKHIKHTAVDTFRPLEEKCVSETVKYGTKISKVS